MAQEIRFVLSDETDQDFKEALKKWATAKAAGFKISDLRREEVGEGDQKIPEVVIVLKP